MKILLLEDDIKRITEFRQRFLSIPHKQIFYTDTAQTCIELLKSEEFDLIFLDHDLGGKVFVDINEKNTGSEVARYISQNPLNSNPIIIIHTLNPVGGKYMIDTIGGRNTFYIPFIWTKKVFDERVKQNTG